MKILAFSDLHGNIEVLKMLVKRVEEESFDCILIAGDLTNADLIRDPESIVKQTEEVFYLLEKLETPYYFVWGLPNREHRIVYSLSRFKKKDENKEDRISLLLLRLFKKRVKNKEDPYSYIGREVSSLLSSLLYGKCLNETKVEKLGPYKLTCEPERVDEKTVFITHCYRKTSGALIQLEGHIHYGQLANNYLNLGFLFRDAEHGAPPLIGCYWILELLGQKVSVQLVNLGRGIKEYRCSRHPEEGIFYLPFYWRKCPVCYDGENAIFSK